MCNFEGIGMLKVFDFMCKAKGCQKQFIPIERFVEASVMDMEECDFCHRPLQQIISAPMGYVKGTENPVKHKPRGG